MKANVIRHRAGTAERLRSGGWLIHTGDLLPMFAADEERVWRELNARVEAKGTRR